MKLALRGVMDRDGDIIVWPMLLMDHAQAFQTLRHLADYRVRFRQWEPDGKVDIDPGADPADVAAVQRFVSAFIGASE